MGRFATVLALLLFASSAQADKPLLPASMPDGFGGIWFGESVASIKKAKKCPGFVERATTATCVQSADGIALRLGLERKRVASIAWTISRENALRYSREIYQRAGLEARSELPDGTEVWVLELGTGGVAVFVSEDPMIIWQRPLT